MARTNSTAVEEILLSDYGNTTSRELPSLTPSIETAGNITDRVAVKAAELGVTHTSATLELIERWLAAHCYKSSDQAFAENETLTAKAVYQGKTGMGLEGTKYGQMAMLLDFSGALTAMNRQRIAKAVWLGRYPSDQTDYVDKE